MGPVAYSHNREVMGSFPWVLGNGHSTEQEMALTLTVSRGSLQAPSPPLAAVGLGRAGVLLISIGFKANTVEHEVHLQLVAGEIQRPSTSLDISSTNLSITQNAGH